MSKDKKKPITEDRKVPSPSPSRQNIRKINNGDFSSNEDEDFGRPVTRLYERDESNNKKKE